MIWINPFRKKKEIVLSNEVIVAQMEFTKKMGELIGKYNYSILEYQKIIKSQNEMLKIYGKRTAVVDKPDFLNDNTAYKPKIRINASTGNQIITIKPEEIYTSSRRIIDIVNSNNWRELYVKDKKSCADTILKYVIDNIDYEYDNEEDWRYSTTTLEYGKGDCEDTCILFMDLAREAGFKADEIFNATGWVTISKDKKFGHSFPIVNYGEGWYIYETTLSKMPTKPMKFEGSKYDCTWGLSNFWFSGKLKNNKKQI